MSVSLENALLLLARLLLAAIFLHEGFTKRDHRREHDEVGSK